MLADSAGCPLATGAFAAGLAAAPNEALPARPSGGAEGGIPVQHGIPLPVVYTLSEIGNLLSLCGPAFFVGVLAIVLGARALRPRWLSVFSLLAGLCGILLPFYFVIPVYLLWAVTFGVWLVAKAPRPLTTATAPLV